ncbi:MAG: hypothetical protein ACLPIG_04920 [Methylocella sp.]
MGSNNPVLYIDFGYVSAKQFWAEVALSAYEQFKSNPNRQNAMQAAVPAWHVLDWIWHERHRGKNTQGNDDFENFRRETIRQCPELALVRDVADASKHCGLGRLKGTPKEIQRVKRKARGSGPLNTYAFNTKALNSSDFTVTLTIFLNDGTERQFDDVLKIVIDYWEKHFNSD